MDDYFCNKSNFILLIKFHNILVVTDNLSKGGKIC